MSESPENQSTCATCNFCDVREILPPRQDLPGGSRDAVMGHFCRKSPREQPVDADYWCGQHTDYRARADRAFFAAHALNALLIHSEMTAEKEVRLAFEYADRMLEKSL